MTLQVDFKSNHVVDALVNALGPEGRRAANSVAASAIKNAVQRHIRSYMRTKHGTAGRLGARPTGHYEKGAAAISWNADQRGGEVRIPIPGIARAWGDISIRPGPGKSALTLPVAAIAYGRTVAEVRALGWTVFRPRGKDYLMGAKNGEENTVLYTLKGGVVQRRDPSLLPTMDEIADTGASAIVEHAMRAMAKARAGGLR